MMKKITSKQEDIKNGCTVEEMLKISDILWKNKILTFFKTRMYHFQIDFKQKKNLSKILFPSKVMKSQSFLKNQKMHTSARHYKQDFEFS
jgi:hypothetical protein